MLVGVVCVAAGRRKGSAPEGEAWFDDGTTRTSMLAMRRMVCMICPGVSTLYFLAKGYGGILKVEFTNLPLQTRRVTARPPPLRILVGFAKDV